MSQQTTIRKLAELVIHRSKNCWNSWLVPA